MTTNPSKNAICWGLFRIVGLPHMFEKESKLERSSYVKMKVTSFTKNRRTGTVMVHGANYETGESTHRKADGMFFYQTEEAMNQAIESSKFTESALIKGVREALAASSEAQRHYRVVMEQHLGKHAIQPIELEVL